MIGIELFAAIAVSVSIFFVAAGGTTVCIFNISFVVTSSFFSHGGISLERVV